MRATEEIQVAHHLTSNQGKFVDFAGGPNVTPGVLTSGTSGKDRRNQRDDNPGRIWLRAAGERAPSAKERQRPLEVGKAQEACLPQGPPLRVQP